VDEMVKHKIRRKAERAARAGGTETTRDANEDAETAADADAAMASLTSSHRRKVKKRAKFLESAFVDASIVARASERDDSDSDSDSDEGLTDVDARRARRQRFAWRRRPR
jgi:hypothetical protein